jgi:1,4-alpha-glucan branching enzyme
MKKDEIKRKIQFKFYAPHANEVYLTGSFNKWNPIKKKLKKNEKGEWLTRVILSEGEHHYKYIVDGEWINDPGAERFVENGVGGLNSVKIV